MSIETSKTDDSSFQTRRVALVTGSARGIGEAIARAFAQEGYNIVLNCPFESGREDLEMLASEISSVYGVEVRAQVADVSCAEEAQALVAQAHSAWGRLDVLVNNAGITRDGLMMRMKESDFDDVIAVNLKGTFSCCKAATKYMMKQRFGRIINLSSVVGISGNAGQVNYAASKAGVIGLTKSLSREVASRNITVNAIAPGFIQTAMTDALSESQRAAIADRIGSGRLGTPEDIAGVALFFASDAAAYITGQVLCVDGGLSL